MVATNRQISIILHLQSRFICLLIQIPALFSDIFLRYQVFSDIKFFQLFVLAVCFRSRDKPNIFFRVRYISNIQMGDKSEAELREMRRLRREA